MEIILVGFVLLYSSVVNAKTILVVPHQAPSHCIYLNAVGAGLVERGHTVYTVAASHFPQSKLKPFTENGLHILTYQTPPEALNTNSDEYHRKLMDSVFSGTAHPITTGVAYHDCEWMLEDEKFMKQLQHIGFDMVIVDGFVLSPCGYLIPYLLGVPYVTVSTAIIQLEIGVPAMPSFVPSALLLSSDKMSFKERLTNFLLTFFGSSFITYIWPNVHNYTLLHKYISDPSISTWMDLYKKSELFIMTRGHTLEWPMPVMPHLISVECMTCTPGKPLPEDLENYMSNSPHGVILVSFGSLAAYMPHSIQVKLLETFAKRPENFVWKVTSDVKILLEQSKQVTKNVKLMTWMPQNDILAHPNTKLFLTHGGNNGQYESVYHGVPMVGFPIFGEQFHNCFRVADHGFGECLDFKDFTVDELLLQIDHVLSNPSYKDRVKKASKIIKSRPMSARQVAAYWIDHVMEFGSDHLRSSAMDIPRYSYWMFDIVAFIVLVLTVTVYCIKLLFVSIYRWLCKTQKLGKLKKN